METRPLGRTGPRVSEIGLCLAGLPDAEELERRARRLGCTFFWSAPRPEAELVRYNLAEQTEANAAIARLAREGRGIVATHVLAGGALAGAGDERTAGPFRFLVKPGRTLAQAAIQFVLANEPVSCALVRATRPEHVEEVLGAGSAPPLTGQELEQIFENWSNRYERPNSE
jgi:aryl-alcohol dehydrogenase-like predicted oxidoreductase